MRSKATPLAITSLVALAISTASSARAQGAHEGVTITPAPVPAPHEGVTITPLPAPPPPAPQPPRPRAARSPRPPKVVREPAPGVAAAFGDPATIVIVGGASFGLSVSPQHRSTLGRALDLGAALEVFPFRRVSFGSVFSVAYANYLDGQRTVGFGFTERVGYLFVLSRAVTFWPRLGIEGRREIRENGQDPGHASSIALTAYLPLQVEPLPHLLIGVGPEGRADLRQELDGAPRPLGARLGLSTEVVAWF